MPTSEDTPLKPWQQYLHTIIFEADTPGGKAFDIALLVAIVVSLVAVCLESVADFRADHLSLLRTVEWTLTILFTIEYVLRLLCVGKPMRYALSFYGIVDLLAILPSYLSLVFGGGRSLTVIRGLRLLRVFRVLKLSHFLNQADVLVMAVRASAPKIIVFLGAVVVIALILGTVMYMIEGDADSGFTSIPQSMYWAIVTLTTVGYGDIAPVTVPGKFLASIVMILGYGIIAVPTGIVTAEVTMRSTVAKVSTQACPQCGGEGHAVDADFCKKCGASL